MISKRFAHAAAPLAFPREGGVIIFEGYIIQVARAQAHTKIFFLGWLGGGGGGWRWVEVVGVGGGWRWVEEVGGSDWCRRWAEKKVGGAGGWSN